MARQLENIALFDMDGTLCDYDRGLMTELNKLRSPGEPVIKRIIKKSDPEYVRARSTLITSSEKWWANLPEFKLGFDVWNLAEDMGYKRMILTQGPRRNPAAWSGKKIWIDNHLGQDVDITITRDKGLVYGKILVDDYPEYAQRWLSWRPRGLVIMPANENNSDYKHPQVIKYDGHNLSQVKQAMKMAKLRSGE